MTDIPAHIDRNELWAALWHTCATWDEYNYWLDVLVWYRWGAA